MHNRSRFMCSALTSIAVLLLAGCENPQNDVTNAAPPDSTVEDIGSIDGVVAALAASRLGGPFERLTADEQARFAAGQVAFEEVETAEDGLGPVFNEASCATCHTNPVGGIGANRIETRFGRTTNGVFDPLANFGGSLIQDRAIGAVGGDPPTHVFVAEVVPAEANVRTGRLTTPLFGLGLVDAVPDEVFLRLARRQAARTPRTAGTPNMVLEISTGQMRVGRFGWKAQVPTLHQFAGDAYLNEMGITNPDFPDESCPQGDCAALAFNPAPDLNNDGEDVDAFADFMTLMAPPARGRKTFQVAQGAVLFAQVGCADCHTPSLTSSASPVGALSQKTFAPFSDFLLHDMGSLGDGIVQGNSTGRQMRTAPLWGVRTRTALLHDGRAKSVFEAIRAHSGQGRFARDRFFRLGFRSRAALLAFVNSL